MLDYTLDYMLDICMLDLWLGAYINGCDSELNWVLRELFRPFGLIKCDIWDDICGVDVKRELRVIYMHVCYGCACAHFELYVVI